MSRVTSLNQEFWKTFSSKVWERKSAVFKDVATPLLEMNDREIFKLLVLYSNRCRKLKSADGLKFYVDGQRQFESEVLRMLPKQSDQSLLGYHERMSEMFDDYCLVCDELLQVNHAQKDLLLQFTEGLYQQVGLPNRFAEMGLYLGNYRKTPFGIHVDGCGVFSFPVVGQKAFRIWKPNYVSRHPKMIHAATYTAHKAHSRVLKVSPGDMAYWPSSAWHIAESNGSFSATWSLGIWVDQKHGETLSNVITDLIVEKLGASADTGVTRFDRMSSSTGEVDNLPPLYRESLETLTRLSPEEMKTAFQKAWLTHSSKEGFKTVPHVELNLKQGASIRLANRRLPVRWIFAKNESKFYYAFNGEMSVGAKSKMLSNFVKRLNAGETLSPKSLSQTDLKIIKGLAIAGAFVAGGPRPQTRSVRPFKKFLKT